MTLALSCDLGSEYSLEGSVSHRGFYHQLERRSKLCCELRFDTRLLLGLFLNACRLPELRQSIDEGYKDAKG
jgi:hypothetical protein